MSKQAAASALVSMWSCVALSLGILYLAGRLGPWVAALVIGLAGIGSAGRSCSTPASPALKAGKPATGSPVGNRSRWSDASRGR